MNNDENHMVQGERFEESYDREPDEDAAYEELRQDEIDRRYARMLTDDLIDTIKSLDKVDDGTVIRALMGWNE